MCQTEHGITGAMPCGVVLCVWRESKRHSQRYSFASRQYWCFSAVGPFTTWWTFIWIRKIPGISVYCAFVWHQLVDVHMDAHSTAAVGIHCRRWCNPGVGADFDQQPRSVLWNLGHFGVVNTTWPHRLGETIKTQMSMVQDVVNSGATIWSRSDALIKTAAHMRSLPFWNLMRLCGKIQGILYTW